MSLLPKEALDYIGIQTKFEFACDVVEKGAVRRYAQGIMDADPIYDLPCEENNLYGGPVSPLLFPTHMFRTAFGGQDPIQRNAFNSDADGSEGVSTIQGLPDIAPLKHLSVMNGGSTFEFYRYAKHGEKIKVQSRYADIYEKKAKEGYIIIVVTISDYFTEEEELLLSVRRTQIRR